MKVALRIATLIFMALLAGRWATVSADSPADQVPAVVILNSYHQGYEWSDSEIQGLLEGLHTVHPGLAPVIEHLDLKRFSGEDHENRLRGFLADKYRDQRIDLAVILDNPAFDLILSHRDEILPGVPIVFAGVNDFTSGMLKGQSKITGVAEGQDHAGTLALALGLHPGTRRVLAVHDYTASGLAVRREMEAVLPAFRDRVQVNFTAPATYEEMAAQIAGLTPDSLALILSFATDSAGKALAPDQSTAVLTAQARVPVYAMHETRLGHGIVGGMLIGGAEHGRRAAALALRVLAGEDPASMPVETQGISRPMFDYVQLQRFDIPLDALPAGSVLVNRPVSLYEQHKAIIWWAAGIIGLLLVLIGSLLFLLQRKNRAERGLRVSEERLKEAQAIARIGRWELDCITKELHWSESIFDLFEIDHSEFGASYEAFLGAIHPSDRDRVNQTFSRCLADKTPYEISHRLLMPDGRVKWVVEACRTDYDEHGKPLRSIGIAQDITERKQAEIDLQAQRDMLETIFENSPFIMMLVDQDVRVKRINRVGADFAGKLKEEILDLLCGEVVRCINSSGGLGCGKNAVCGECLVRTQVVHTLKTGDTILDAQGKFAVVRESQELMLDMLVSTARVKVADQDFVLVTMSDITERVQAVAALLASEERYRLLFEEMTAAFALHEMIFDENGKPCDYKFLKVNPAFERLTGLRAGDVIGRRVSEVIPGIGDSWIARYGKVVLTGEPVQFDDYSSHLGKYFEVRAFRAGPGQFAVVFQDITERKQAAAALSESEANFRLLVETGPEAIFIQTRGCFTYLNSTALKLFQADSAEALIGRPLTDRIHPDHHAAALERSRVLNEEKQPVPTTEQIYLRMDGSPVPVEVSAVPFKYQGDNGALVFARDITARKKAEAALRESEERHSRIVEASSDAFLLRSGEIVIYANPAALKLFRANHPGDLTGKRYLDLVHPDDRAISAERIKKSRDQNLVSPPREHRILALDGQVVQVESIGGIVKHRGETQMFGVFRDITERKRDEQEKEKLEAQLRQAQKMEAIGTLAGGIAHDFNNILSVIIGNAEILEFTTPLGDSSREGVGQILAAAQRAKQLVRQILAFSRHGKQEKILIDPKPIVMETLEFLRASLPASIQLQHYLEPASGKIMADPTQMQQILMNLCTNAGHAMEKDGGCLQIKLSNTAVTEEDARFDPEAEPGGYVKLTVSDTGHGMEPSVLQRIFDPYFTTKAPGKGTGLGLSVVHGIVKSHGGMIKVYSEVGKGTTFTVFLPRAEGFEKAEEKPLQPMPMGTETILFIDDEKALADLGRQMLGGLGYQVETRTSPIEALEAFRAHPQRFDLVITDMTMPQLTGLKLARKLMEIRPDIPIILCTGFSEQANEQAAAAMGIRALLYKPLVMRDIADAVRKVLDGKMSDMQ